MFQSEIIAITLRLLLNGAVYECLINCNDKNNISRRYMKCTTHGVSKLLCQKQHELTQIGPWISNHISGIMWYVIVHPCPTFSGGLTNWDRVTDICVRKLTISGSDNGLSPGRHQVIIWTNAGILLIQTLGTIFSEISSEIHTFSLK